MGILYPMRIYLDKVLHQAASKPEHGINAKEKRAIRYCNAYAANINILLQLNRKGN